MSLYVDVNPYQQLHLPRQTRLIPKEEISNTTSRTSLALKEDRRIPQVVVSSHPSALFLWRAVNDGSGAVELSFCSEKVVVVREGDLVVLS